ncbi:MAG: clostripain-related cysteine peptidase [Vulcanimicrobiota bacterium]
MKKQRTFPFLIVLLTFVLFSVLALGCGGGGGGTAADPSATTPGGDPTSTPTGGDQTPSPTPTPGVTREWTFMVYIACDNNLEYYDFQDVKEMESIGSTENVNIIVQWDRMGFENSVDWSGSRRYYVNKDSQGSSGLVSTMMADLGPTNSGDPNTLVSFVQWGVTNFPADKYGLVLWNHGSGWKKTEEFEVVKGICWDDTSNDHLTQAELRQALAQITTATGGKLEFLGMDACVMGMVEVAYDAKDYAKYLSFSEANEPGDGWNYEGFLDDLIANPSMNGGTLANHVVTAYGDYYAGYNTVTQSAVDLSKIDALVTAVNNFSNQGLSLMGTNRDDFNTCVQNAATPSSNYVDLGDFCLQVVNNGNISDATMNTYAQAVITTIDNMVLSTYNGSTYSACQGLTIWIPSSADYSIYASSYQSLPFATDSTWDDFIQQLQQ